MFLKQSIFFVLILLTVGCLLILYTVTQRLIPANILARLFSSAPIDSLQDDDPRLIELIRSSYLVPPSKLPYSLPFQYYLTDGQAAVVNRILKGKTNGMFVEAGASTGYSMSNSMFFERNKGWKGLLVEPDHKRFKLLLKVHRKAIASNCCLSLHRHPQTETLQQRGSNSPRIVEGDNGIYESDIFLDHLSEVKCFPLQSLLWAANITTIDYLSLDLEGQELKVLKFFPWNHFYVKVISVEFKHIPGGAEPLKSFMEKINYFVVREIADVSGEVVDLIFVHQNLIESVNQTEIRSMKITNALREP